MALLTRKQIGEKPRPEKIVTVPEWGGDVRLLQMTADERDAWEGFVAAGKAASGTPVAVGIRSLLVAKCLVDETGKRLYADNETADLSASGSVVVDRLFDACLELNKLRQEDVEAVAKNSGSAPTGASG